MLELRKITKENYDKCFGLKVNQEQSKFVASNITSLAEAWVFYDTAIPFAIYNDDTMVGFLMLSINKTYNSYDIWRLMIDEKYQNKGYGKEAINLALEYIKNDENWNGEIYVLVVPENKQAIKLYQSFGFKETKEFDFSEVVLVYKKE